jgi:hypothetical protein
LYHCTNRIAHCLASSRSTKPLSGNSGRYPHHNAPCARPTQSVTASRGRSCRPRHSTGCRASPRIFTGVVSSAIGLPRDGRGTSAPERMRPICLRSWVSPLLVVWDTWDSWDCYILHARAYQYFQAAWAECRSAGNPTAKRSHASHVSHVSRRHPRPEPRAISPAGCTTPGSENVGTIPYLHEVTKRAVGATAGYGAFLKDQRPAITGDRFAEMAAEALPNRHASCNQVGR